MHELSVCQSMLAQVESIAAEHQASGVAAIHLEIGPLAGVEAQLLQAAFPLASAGTVAEDAELILKPLPIRVQCMACGAESAATANRLVCGHCGYWQTKLLSGDELLLASVELIQ